MIADDQHRQFSCLHTDGVEGDANWSYVVRLSAVFLFNSDSVSWDNFGDT